MNPFQTNNIVFPYMYLLEGRLYRQPLYEAVLSEFDANATLLCLVVWKGSRLRDGLAASSFSRLQAQPPKC